MLVALWSLSHRYKGLDGDAELYAVQAMARIQSGLTSDLFLQYGSQDKYTIFSPFYAWCIRWLGLPHAALALTIIFKVWLFAAAWAIAREISNSRIAFMAITLLIVAVGTYGGYGVFRFAEDWLTARSMAEALVISAIGLHFCGLRITGLLVAVLALFAHPILAFPGLLVLASLWCSLRISVIAAVVGLATAIALSLWARDTPSSVGVLAVMDPEWLEVVRERSVFLFPHLWPAGDWGTNARPFLSLAIVAMAVPDERVRKLCIGAMLIGATGLAVAVIAGTIGHIAILIQGQAWRWMWITSLVSVLLLAPAAATIYRDPRCGPITAMLLISGWIFPPANGIAFVALALVLWLLRERIDSRTAVQLGWATGALGLIIASWAAFDSWSAALAPAADLSRDEFAIGRIRNVMGLQVPAFALALLLIYGIGKTRSVGVAAFILLCLGICIAFVIPQTIKDPRQNGSPTAVIEFDDWRTSIPPAANVYVAPAYNSAAFAWFTLQRPSYMSVGQSAGVVFSRATAMEVKRRSNVLLPVLDPDWRLLTGGNTASDSDSRVKHRPTRPLTKESLASVCLDARLDFVVAKEYVGFDPIQHKHVGGWKDTYLYNCGHVRSATPTT
jgi:hypothetical protein